MPIEQGSPSSGSTGIVTTTKTTADFLKDGKVIAGAVIGVVVAIFFAGFYYQQASQQIESYKRKIDTAEVHLSESAQKIQRLETKIAELDVLGGLLSQLRFQKIDAGKAQRVNTTEPKNDGGGNAAECPVGTYIGSAQIHKSSDGIRSVNFWCLPFPDFPKK